MTVVIFSVILTGLLLAATAFDLTGFRIPNFIPLILIGLFVLKVGSGIVTSSPAAHVVIATLSLILGFLAFAAGFLGGGDAKLIAALALWFGPENFVEFITITGIAGGFAALLLMLLRRLIRVEALDIGGGGSSTPYRVLNKSAPLPYALPITVAALWLEWYRYVI